MKIFLNQYKGNAIFLILLAIISVACSAAPTSEPAPYVSALQKPDEVKGLMEPETVTPAEVVTSTVETVRSLSPTSLPSVISTDISVPPAALVSSAETKSFYLPILTRPRIHYVSKLGSNENGRSWETAWNELDQINWDVIEPGAEILIDGGESEMVYTSQLHIQKTGTSNKPIWISLADQAGRNGKVVIFGGRTIPLPYCGQTTYSYITDGVRANGVHIEDSAWVIIDGLKWGGITIHGHNGRGMRFDSDSNNITVRNTEIYDNGIASQNDEGEWRPNMPGVGLAGSGITFERALIHDNGQDAFQSMSGENNIADFTIRLSWLYNSRIHPIVNEAFNHCRHPDGLQIFDGGVISGVTIEESIIGPGLTQGVIFGQSETAGGSLAIVNDVTLRNTLFTKASGLNIMGYPDVKSQRWIIDNVTSHCPTQYTGVCLWLEGTDHAVTNSIFSGSQIVLPDGLDTFYGNCQWNSEGFVLGQIVNPLFTDVDETDPFSLDDYSLLPNSPCTGRGSSITSVSQLLSIP